MVRIFSMFPDNKAPFSAYSAVALTLVFVYMLLFSSSALALTQVTATVDKNPAMLNESILLTVTADDDIDRNALDTKPLLDDFIVGQTSVSSQTSMVNFKTTRITQWQVILIARNTGQFTIPALSIKNQQSEPIELSVLDTSSANTSMQSDIFITSELSSQQVYVQQLLTLSLKLHFSVELKSGNLTEPNLTGASIEKVGQDKQSDSVINGKRYRVIEQTYAITPEQSGEFTLASPVFSGEILQASKRRSSFLSFAQTKPVSILGDELKLTVLPIPANYPAKAQWLPSELLTLHQEWQSADGKFQVGEPITRTITLTAAGLSKAQLPQLKMKNSRGLKIYPDQADLHANLSKERLVSQKVQNFAIVPSAAGDFVLPAMNITWFNTITKKIEQATLPAQTISVLAAEGANIADANIAVDEPQQSADITRTQSSTKLTEQENSSASTNVVEDKRLQWLFLSLWLLTSVAWLAHVIYLKRVDDSNNQDSLTVTANTGNFYLALLSACKKNNAEQALNLVLPWLRQLLSAQQPALQINNIAQAQAIVQEQSFATALNELQQHLYGKSAINGAPSWQGMALLRAIQTVNKQQSSKDNHQGSLSLNP